MAPSTSSRGEPDDETVAAVAATLLRAAATAAQSETTREQPTAVFDSISPPPLSLLDYGRRIFKYFQCSHESAVICLAYIDRFLTEQPDFRLSSLNVHRLLLTGAVLAAKFFDDTYLFNSYYAQVGGVSLKELNMLEATFLEVIRWRLHVQREEYDRYHALVLRRHDASASQDGKGDVSDIDSVASTSVGANVEEALSPSLQDGTTSSEGEMVQISRAIERQNEQNHTISVDVVKHQIVDGVGMEQRKCNAALEKQAFGGDLLQQVFGPARRSRRRPYSFRVAW